MQKFRILTIVITCCFMITSSLPVYAESSQNKENNNQEEANNTENEGVWKIYNSQGELIGTTTNPDSFILSNETNQPRSLKKLIGKITVTAVWGMIQTVSTVEWVYEKVVGTATWLNNNIKFSPDLNGNFTIHIYSNDGKVSNPYPPNSYEGWYWSQNNFYYVVEYN